MFLLAASVRGAYLVDSRYNPTFYAPIVDSLRYDQIARGLVEGRGMSEEFFWQPVFYPLFLSFVYLLSGSSILAVKVVQVVVGGLTAVLAYRTGERIFGRVAGVIAGVVVSFYMPLVFLEGELLAAGWAAFWSVALILLFLKVKEEPKIWVCVLLGLCGALSIMTRPEFLPFFAAGCVWLLFSGLRNKIPAGKAALTMLMVAGGFLLAAWPVARICYRVTGRAAILPLTGGINLYIGNNPNYEQTIMIRPGAGWRKLSELPIRNGVRDFYKQDEWFLSRTRDYIFNNPAGFIKGLCHKAVQFISSREIPRNLDIYLFRKWSNLLAVGVWKTGTFGFPFGVLLPMAVCGAVYWRKIPTPVWLFILLYPAAVILVFVASRYRVPAIPVISILAAGGCAGAVALLRGREWKRLTVFVIAGVAATAVGMAGEFPEEKFDYEPELYFSVAQSLDRHGRTEEAIGAYRKAIELKGDYAEAYNNLGNVYLRQERYEQAEEQYVSAIKADPKNAVSQLNLGACREKQGRINEAVECYRKAIAIDPQYGLAHKALEDAMRGKSKP